MSELVLAYSVLGLAVWPLMARFHVHDDRTGHILLLDLGLATHFSLSKPRLTTCCGSPAYHSPGELLLEDLLLVCTQTLVDG